MKLWEHNITKFLAGLFVLFAVIMLVNTSYPYFVKAWHSKSWPSTQALITQSSVDDNAGDLGGQYRLLFTYTYEVAGRVYHNSGRYMRDGETPQRVSGNLYRFAEAHPTGALIEVYYNPNDPNEASTQVGFIWLHWILVGLVISFSYLAIKLLFFPGTVKSRWSKH
ncbi:MAG: DUF3592 domain-containing protein [Bacteroidota bacterium]